jgi:membrane protein required for colicin V production
MQLSDWTALDYLFVTILLISTVFAMLRGFVREIICLVGLVTGFLLAAWYYPLLSSRLLDYARNETVADLVAFLIILLICYLLGAVTAFLIRRIVKEAKLQWIDRLLGGVFGVVRGWSISCAIVLALIAFPVREGLVERSLFAPYLLAGARAAIVVVPQDLKGKFNEQYKKILQSWNQNRKLA